MKELVKFIVAFEEIDHFELVDKDVFDKIEHWTSKIPYNFNNERLYYVPKDNYEMIKEELGNSDLSDAQIIISGIDSIAHKNIYFII